MSNLNVLENENEKQFIWRAGALIDGGAEITWEEVAELLNATFRKGIREVIPDTCHKNYTAMKGLFDANVFKLGDTEDVIKELRSIRNEISKEKQELHDERVAFNREKREENRSVSFAEKIIEALDDYEFPVYDYTPNPVHLEGESDLIIHLTDLHCGNEVNYTFNQYNVDKVKDRLDKYLDNIYTIKNTHFAENANVILGGDLIQGLIHVNSRIEAKEDIVSQIIYATEYISNFLATLSGWFNTVNVYSVVGNHGRAVANKDEAVRKENFDRLVTWACSKELSAYKNIVFGENTLDVDIANFEVRGWNIWATHGDKDTPSNVVTHFTNFARHCKIAPPDVCYLGHRHCNGLSTHDGIKVIESGSAVGMDSYCVGRRLCGWPEQTVTVVTNEKAVSALYDITLE